MQLLKGEMSVRPPTSHPEASTRRQFPLGTPNSLAALDRSLSSRAPQSSVGDRTGDQLARAASRGGCGGLDCRLVAPSGTVFERRATSGNRLARGSRID
jgi:hypothetical protein